MKDKPKISIIIRAKNEEKWIPSCLSSVFRQGFKDFEVILVDNCSTDRTVEKAKTFPVKEIVPVEQFLPGKALNLGIGHSEGDYIVCLSAHCIPTNEKWLDNLLANFSDDSVAGVYGRQEPMAFTKDVDKRDLINVFGLDRKIQKKDPFFHNANSMIRRDIWEQFPFSETTSNIEDRLWAMEVLKKGYRIVYEPGASVYHYHGINQGRNVERARNVVRILEEIHPTSSAGYVHEDIDIMAIIPVRAPVKQVGEKSLLEFAIESVKRSRYVNRLVVAADNEDHLKIAASLNTQGILRPPELSYEYIEAIKVYQYVLSCIQEKGQVPDLLVLLQEVYPFRPVHLIDNMIERLIHSDYDSVIAAKPIYKSLWRENGDDLTRVDNGFMPSKYKEAVFMALYGLGCVMEPGIVLEGNKLGHRVGIVIVDNPYSAMTASMEEELKMVEALMPKWREYNQDREL